MLRVRLQGIYTAGCLGSVRVWPERSERTRQADGSIVLCSRLRCLLDREGYVYRCVCVCIYIYIDARTHLYTNTLVQIHLTLSLTMHR